MLEKRDIEEEVRETIAKNQALYDTIMEELRKEAAAKCLRVSFRKNSSTTSKRGFREP